MVRGVGGGPHIVELNVSLFFFFPLRDTSSHVFISPTGKINIVNVKTFMLFIPHWRLSPDQYSERNYESVPSLFYFHVCFANKCDTQAVKSQVVGCVPGWHCVTRKKLLFCSSHRCYVDSALSNFDSWNTE